MALGGLTERDQDGCLWAEEVDWMLGMPRRGVLRPCLPSCCCCCCCRPSINALLYTLYVVVAFVPTLPAHRTTIRADTRECKQVSIQEDCSDHLMPRHDVVDGALEACNRQCGMLQSPSWYTLSSHPY